MKTFTLFIKEHGIGLFFWLIFFSIPTLAPVLVDLPKPVSFAIALIACLAAVVFMATLLINASLIDPIYPVKDWNDKKGIFINLIITIAVFVVLFSVAIFIDHLRQNTPDEPAADFRDY